MTDRDSGADTVVQTVRPTLPEVLRAAAAARPGATAIRCGVTTLDVAGLHGAVTRLAARLRDAGVRAGDRVAVALPNTAELAVCYLGVLEAGAVAVPLHPSHARQVQEDRLVDCEPRLLLAAPDLPLPCREAADAAGVPVLAVDAAVCAGGPAPAGDRPPAAPETLAALVYGLVGHDRPAAVELTHANLAHSAAAAARVLGLGPEDTVLGCFPLASVLGQTVGLNATLTAGATLSIPGDVEGDGLLATIVEQRITVLATFPVLMPVLLRSIKARGDAADLSALRTVLGSGGAPVAPALRKGLSAAAGCEVLESFGTPETSGLVCATPSGEPARPGSVGPAAPGVQLRVVDRGADARPGDIGELVMRGPHAMARYWRDPEATAQVVRGGWLYTGFSAVADEDGWCYLTDAGWVGKLNGPRNRGGMLRRALRRLRN